VDRVSGDEVLVQIRVVFDDFERQQLLVTMRQMQGLDQVGA
jgi:hypothetical protein